MMLNECIAPNVTRLKRPYATYYNLSAELVQELIVSLQNVFLLFGV